MATAKQIAWRKKFGAMAKAGTLKKRPKKAAARKRNPVAKKAAPARKRIALVKPTPKRNPAPRRPTPGAKRAKVEWVYRDHKTQKEVGFQLSKDGAIKAAQKYANATGIALEITPRAREY